MTPRDADPLTVPEFDEADNMCPNCVTPWKCNGPHLSEQTVAADSRLWGFREQRRRSRWGCSVALLAIVAALVVFWGTVGVILWRVVAG